MNAQKFKDYILDKAEKNYGMCPPPTDAQEGLNILIKHFLGENWYVTMPISQEQVNTEAIYSILQQYPSRDSDELYGEDAKRLVKDVLRKPNEATLRRNNYLVSILKKIRSKEHREGK